MRFVGWHRGCRFAAGSGRRKVTTGSSLPSAAEPARSSARVHRAVDCVHERTSQPPGRVEPPEQTPAAIRAELPDGLRGQFDAE
jgi:hypothetical protein